MDVGLAPAAKSVWTDLPGEIDQLWAEAVVRWQTGEPLFLKGEIEAAAKEAQEAHREVNTREGIILDFLERPVPEDWQNWPLDRRRMFWGGAVQGDVKLVPRDRVCALEVWCEALDGKQRDMRYSDTAEINSIIEASALWKGPEAPYALATAASNGAFKRCGFDPEHCPEHLRFSDVPMFRAGGTCSGQCSGKCSGKTLAPQGF